MSGPDTSGEDADLLLREQLSSLQALLALAMRMTDTEDQDQILRLAATAVPALSRCRLIGAYHSEDGWHVKAFDAADRQAREDLEAQFAVLSAAGGAIGVGRERWAWAFPLRSLGSQFGFLAVAADAEPVPGELFLLRVLAQQTGVALANARLHGRQRQQAVDLLGANSQLADTLAKLERSAGIHERLTQVAVAGEGQEGIAEALYELTGLSVAVEDRHGNLRAWAGPGRPEPYPKQTQERREALLRRALDAGGPSRHDGRLVMAHPRGDGFGVLALVDPEDTAGELARVALEHGAAVLAMEMARLWGIAESEKRLRTDLVDDLLAGTELTSAMARAETLGYDLGRSHRAVVVEAGPDVPDADEFFHAVRRASRDTGVGTLLASRGHSVVVLANTERPWEMFRLAIVQELSGRRCRVGVGSACEDLADLARSHHEAMLSLRVQQLATGGDQAIAFDDLGVYRLLASVEDLEGIEGFVRFWLGDLQRYDATKGASDLVSTLSHYLDCGGNYDATAPRPRRAPQHPQVPAAADPRDLRSRPRLAGDAVQPAARRTRLADPRRPSPRQDVNRAARDPGWLTGPASVRALSRPAVSPRRALRTVARGRRRSPWRWRCARHVHRANGRGFARSP